MSKRKTIIFRDIRIQDWLLIVGLILAPMTAFRIAKIGPAEALCAAWTLFYFPRKKITRNAILSFFIVFLSSMLLGTVWGYIVVPSEVVLGHWFTWIYLAYISLAMYEGLRNNQLEYNENMFELFSRGAAIWYLFLYLYSLFISKTFLGAPLWFYGYRFTGGATNPHQIALLMCGLTFYFLRNVFKGKKMIINAFFASICLYLELQTDASTGIASLSLSAFVLVLILVGHIFKGKRVRNVVYFLEGLIILAVVIIGYRYIYNLLFDWIMSDSNGVGRINLMHQITNSFKKGPIFGLGPGVHAFDLMGNAKEYHSTYLEILASSGIVGMTAFIILTVRSFKKMRIDDLFLPILVAIYVYGFGGYALRRLIYWGFFVFIFVISEQMNERINGDDYEKVL